MDFVRICTRSARKDRLEVYPKFVIGNTKDVMIKGGDFYAFWDEKHKKWSTSQDDVIKAIDAELDEYVEKHKDFLPGSVYVCYMWDSDSGSIDKWHHFCKKQMHDHYKPLDDSIIFLNDPQERENYSSHCLPYALQEGPIPNYEHLMTTLYSPEERQKIEWAIGSIITGDSKWIQKFIVLTGAPGSGKSTVLLIIKQLFEGYCGKIDAKAIGSANAQFALESVANNPLVAFEDDVKLDKIQDNTKLNSLIAHEELTINEKFKNQYTAKFHMMIFLGSNSDVNITDSRSGLIRRLIDVEPTGITLSRSDYDKCMEGIKFELGGIAWHCREVYLEHAHDYDDYIPVRMMRSTNIVYSWLEENYDRILEKDGITLSSAWASYKKYCDDCDIQYRLNRLELRNELRGYFTEFIPDGYLDDGTHVRSYFSGFYSEKFSGIKNKKEITSEGWLSFDCTESPFDTEFAYCPAQYANSFETPVAKWEDNNYILKDLKTTRLHYVRVPRNLIVVDFDLKNEQGGKDYILNLEAASKWPPTYAELSKSGAGIHLHYWYDGDVSMLSSIYKPGIEIKVFEGLSSLRRMLSYCNNLPIATLNSGLPLRKEEKKTVDIMTFKSERHLISFIVKQLKKETHADTHSSVSFIKKALDDAYASGITYYIPIDMRDDIEEFARNSTNQSKDCLRMVSEMKWESESRIEEVDYILDEPIAIFDIEVYPNLLLICYKELGENKPIYVMKNPTPSDVEEFVMKYRLVGFNNRRYDNHIIYARFMGYSEYGCYELSTRIINSKKRDNDALILEAYNLSYADIYDYSTKKQSLKKWEIELGIDHKEMDIPWNEPIPDERLEDVIAYCKNDVLATEAVWNATQGDFKAREILATWANKSVNTPTNSLTAAIIFKTNKPDKSEFHWRDLSKPVPDWESDQIRKFLQDEVGRFKEPFDELSVVPYFPDYIYDAENKKSTYRGLEVSEGGFVYAEPGIHVNVALLDIESMHPNSFIDEVYAGVGYTRNFKNIMDVRLAVKHGDWELAKSIGNDAMAHYFDSKDESLNYALKIPINSVYGLTSASFENPFYNPQNIDNIVAKRGALFMIDLLYAVKERGFDVAHIKTDSIKIPNATPEIIEFVMEFGRKYGYNFEHEATYERMCLVNNAVYIAKYMDKEICQNMYNYIPGKNFKHSGEWTATGTQFQVPYVFKTLFSHEPIIFDDMCETKTVTTTMYLDYNEFLPEDEHDYHFVGRVGKFTPVIHGGILLRSAGEKYNSVTATKGYRWKESSDVTSIDTIDESYYIRLVDDAKESIAKYGDVEAFLA